MDTFHDDSDRELQNQSSDSLNRNQDLNAYGKNFESAIPLTLDEVFETLNHAADEDCTDNVMYVGYILFLGFSDTLDYCGMFKTQISKEDVTKIRTNSDKLSDLEVVSLCNFMPNTSEQAKLLIPSLESYPEFALKQIIDNLLTRGGDESDDFSF
ncbi:RNA polymerase Rpb4/RPC9 core domain-containing protein [Entamoeba marina]